MILFFIFETSGGKHRGSCNCLQKLCPALWWLWWQVTAVVTSHCHGFHPNSDFVSNALILWNGHCGWRNGDSQPAVTTASDASREAMMLEWHSRVHSDVIVLQSFKQPHLLRAVGTGRRTKALPTNDLSTQTLYQIRQPSMYTFTKPVTLCHHQISELLSENRPQRYSKGEIILIWQKRTTDSLKLVQKKLIRVLPPWPHW